MIKQKKHIVCFVLVLLINYNFNLFSDNIFKTYTDIQYLPINFKKQRIVLKKDSPVLLINSRKSHFKAFKLNIYSKPYKIIIVSYTSYENKYLDNYIKSIFAPQVILLDKNFNIIYSSNYEDLEFYKHLFSEPKFRITLTIDKDYNKAKYLVIKKLNDFDENLTFSYKEKMLKKYIPKVKLKSHTKCGECTNTTNFCINHFLNIQIEKIQYSSIGILNIYIKDYLVH